MSKFKSGHLFGGYFKGKVVAKGEREGSGVIFFVDTLFDVIEVHDDKRMC